MVAAKISSRTTSSDTNASRRLFASLCTVASVHLFSPTPPALAATFLRCEVTLSDGLVAPASGALYVTARPNAIDDVPRAVLMGTRGKPPPIASARLPSTLTFPLAIELDDPSDLTPEGATEPARWWADRKLIVSARLDVDGIAATRDPADLVGQAVCTPAPREESAEQQRQRAPCSLRLVSRGFGGKLITQKAKSAA